MFKPVSLFCMVIITSCLSSSVASPDECDTILEKFATSSANFMLCAISNARPIRMCTSCIGSYRGVINNHAKIFQISEITNKTCRDRLINLDRLEIIEAGYSYVINMWDKGRCKNCFKTEDPSKLTNETEMYQFLWKNTMDCIEANFNSENNTYGVDVCSNCSLAYWTTNQFYDILKNKYGDGHICMDIVDAMNITQNLWSGILACDEEQLPPEVPLLAACSAALALPLLFYLATWKLSAVTPATVSKQKRLSERFVERLRSRTGSFISQLRSRDNTMQQSFMNEPIIS